MSNLAPHLAAISRFAHANCAFLVERGDLKGQRSEASFTCEPRNHGSGKEVAGINRYAPLNAAHPGKEGEEKKDLGAVAAAVELLHRLMKTELSAEKAVHKALLERNDGGHSAEI